MTYTPIPAGQSNWDVPVNAAFTDQDTRITVNAGSASTNATAINTIEAGATMPGEQGLQAWNYDPVSASGTSVLTTGTIYMARIRVTTGFVCSTSYFNVAALGTTLTAGQNFLALYDAAGTQVAITADQTANWGTANFKTTAWVTPVSLTPGYYYLAILTNGAVGISVTRAVSTGASAILSPNFTNATLRWSTGGTGLGPGITAMPASIIMSNRGQSSTATWVALS